MIIGASEHVFIIIHYFEKFNNNTLAEHAFIHLKNLIAINMPEHAFKLKTSKQFMIYIRTLIEFQIDFSCGTFFSL